MNNPQCIISCLCLYMKLQTSGCIFFNNIKIVKVTKLTLEFQDSLENAVHGL